MVQATIEDELVNAMSEVDVILSPDMLTKCVAMVKIHNMSPSELATAWEMHSLNSNIDTLSRYSFPSFRTFLASKQYKSNTTGVSPAPIKRGAIINRPAVGKRVNPNNNGVESPRTKRRVEMQSESNDDMDHKSAITSSPSSATNKSIPRNVVTPSKKQQQTETSTKSNSYGNRKNSGQVVITYNPNRLDPITTSSSSSSNSNSVVEITHPYGSVEEYKYMTDKDRSSALNEHLLSLQNKLLEQERKKLVQTETNQQDKDGVYEEEEHEEEEPETILELVGVPHPTVQFNIGRICNEAHEGKINKTSILLEGSKNGSNGARIAIDVSRMDKKSFSLFPGQIVGVRGVNSSGRKMVVEELIEGIESSIVKTKKGDLKKIYQGGQGGSDGAKIYAVAGPYTTNQDLKYEPLMDLLNLVVREKPAVVIMMGPFVDLRQKLLQEGDEVILEYEQDESDGGGIIKRHVSYETLFAAKISQELEDLYSEFPDLKTKFVLVPSLDDAVSEPVFPQPPLKDSLPGGGKVIPDILETQEIPFGSIGLENIETAGDRKVPKNMADRRVHLVSNPATIKVNEVTIGLTSTDTLLHLSTQEVNQNLPPGTRICRLAEHFIQQQSYYPIFPPPASFTMGVNLDVNKRTKYTMPVQPDVLLLPSKLACLAKDVAGGTVVVNPGFLVKGMTGGTFAVLDVHPVTSKEKLEGSDDEEVENDVHNRIRVEIRKI